MASDLQAVDLKGRIQRVEDWVKTLRWLAAIVVASLGLQMWFLISPQALPSRHDPRPKRDDRG